MDDEDLLYGLTCTDPSDLYNVDDPNQDAPDSDSEHWDRFHNSFNAPSNNPKPIIYTQRDIDLMIYLSWSARERDRLRT